jgi:hypothetical protein
MLCTVPTLKPSQLFYIVWIMFIILQLTNRDLIFWYF